MKNIKVNYLRRIVQASVLITLIITVAIYMLYTREIIAVKFLSIGDLNPYGGWSVLREYAIEGSYAFEGISKSMALTIAILVMSIIGGRFFCGWLCPIGAVQDFTSRSGSKDLNRKSFNPLLLKYPILLLILLLSVLGYGAVIADFSPWRALISLPNLVSAWDEMKPGYIILAGIILSSLFIPRFFCRYFCPLGAVQALFSSMSIISLKYGKGCSGCNRCLEQCPVGIRLSAGDDTASPECIRCLECIEDCRIQKGQRNRIMMGDSVIPIKKYLPIMLLIFMTIWLGLPKLFTGSSIDGSISPGLLKDGIYQGEGKGFAGKIISEVRVTKGKISDIKVLEHHESKGWYEEVFMALPREMIKNQKIYVDGISGATKSSKGLIQSVENAIKNAL